MSLNITISRGIFTSLWFLIQGWPADKKLWTLRINKIGNLAFLLSTRALTKSLSSGHSFTWIFIQQAFYKIFCLWRQRRPGWFIKTGIRFQDCPKYTRFSSCPEWTTPTEKNICNHTNAPYISFCTVRPMQNFRCYIICTSHNVIKPFICKLKKKKLRIFLYTVFYLICIFSIYSNLMESNLVWQNLTNQSLWPSTRSFHPWM